MLLDQVRDKLRLKHHSIRTKAQYVQWIRHFVLFHRKRLPLTMRAAEVEALLTHLAVRAKAPQRRLVVLTPRVVVDVKPSNACFAR